MECLTKLSVYPVVTVGFCYHHSKRTRLTPLLKKDKVFLFLSQRQVMGPRARQGRQGFKCVGVGLEGKNANYVINYAQSRSD